MHYLWISLECGNRKKTCSKNIVGKKLHYRRLDSFVFFPNRGSFLWYVFPVSEVGFGVSPGLGNFPWFSGEVQGQQDAIFLSLKIWWPSLITPQCWGFLEASKLATQHPGAKRVIRRTTEPAGGPLASGKLGCLSLATLDLLNFNNILCSVLFFWFEYQRRQWQT